MAIWIALGIQFILVVITIIGIAVKYSNKIAVLESQNASIKDDFKLHQTMNERAFGSLETEMKIITTKLDQLIGYYKGKTNQELG